MKLYLELFAGNSTRVELQGLGSYTAIEEFSYVNDASVSVTIYDSDDNPVAGASWPVTMAYESGSNGNYSGVVPAALAVNAGDLLTAIVTATSSGQTGYWEIPVEVLARTHRHGFG